MTSNLAPIVLFCYNRPWHIRKTLDGLRANKLASESVLFVLCYFFVCCFSNCNLTTIWTPFRGICSLKGIFAFITSKKHSYSYHLKISNCEIIYSGIFNTSLPPMSFFIDVFTAYFGSYFLRYSARERALTFFSDFTSIGTISAPL